MSSSLLDGPADSGFNVDISMTAPSSPRVRNRTLSRMTNATMYTAEESAGAASIAERQRERRASLSSGGPMSRLDSRKSIKSQQVAGARIDEPLEEMEDEGPLAVGGADGPEGEHDAGSGAEEDQLEQTRSEASRNSEATRTNNNDNHDALLQKATEPVRGLRMRILRFTPSWYAVTMGTGICNTLLFLLPWQSTHAVFRDIGAAFLVLDILIFMFFSSITIARYTLYPQIFMAMLSHPVHSLFLGTIPMGLVTIVSGIAFLGNEYGLPGAVLASAGMWWFALVLSVTTAFMVPFAMQTSHQHTSESLTAAWLLPVVPPITVAATSGVLVNLLYEAHPDYALKIWLAGYIVNGIGLLVAAMILVLYYQRLSLHHLPGRETIISTFLPLGPCGQGGYAILLAGRNARHLFPIIASRNPDNDLAILAELGPALYAIGISCSLLLWGLGMWFLVLAIASITAHRIRGTIVFGMGWWSLTFPLGSLNLLTYGLATAFDNMFFKVVGTIMTAIVIFNWATVSIPTLKGWWTGSLFQAPCLVKVPNLLERAEKEKRADQEANRG